MASKYKDFSETIYSCTSILGTELFTFTIEWVQKLTSIKYSSTKFSFYSFIERPFELQLTFKLDFFNCIKSFKFDYSIYIHSKSILMLQTPHT